MGLELQSDMIEVPSTDSFIIVIVGNARQLIIMPFISPC